MSKTHNDIEFDKDVKTLIVVDISLYSLAWYTHIDTPKMEVIIPRTTIVHRNRF